MSFSNLFPSLPHEGPPIPRFMVPRREDKPTSQKPTPTETQAIGKPGCIIADSTLTAYGQLMGLSEGWGGFGVLQQSREHIENAVKAARSIGKNDIAEDLLNFSELLPDVHTPDDASEAMIALKPIVQDAWELGKLCGLTHARAEKALEMIKSGELPVS